MAPEIEMVVLSPEKCWARIAGAHVARLAVAVGGQPDIYPVTVFVNEAGVFFRTVPGTKLAALATNQRVALEWDGLDDDGTWSVVIRAHAHRQPPERAPEYERQAARLWPVASTGADEWVTLTAEAITGRFVPGARPAD